MLGLQNNSLTGPVPDSIYNLTKLERLYLDRTELEGEIPTAIAQLTNLEQYRLYSSKFGGTLPAEVFALAQLVELNIRNNTFSGGLSEDFQNLNKIQKIDVSKNEFTGSIPNVFHTLPFLRTFAERVSMKDGPCTITHFVNFTFLPSFIHFLKTTEELLLQENQFTGSITQDLCNERGLGFGELKILTVDCDVECGCCRKWKECRRRFLF
jgi:Leucine Rich Repeat